MKLYEFQINNKRYALTKYDEYCFSIREYLPNIKTNYIKNREVIQEFQQADNFFGSLEYMLKKAFLLLGKDYIEENVLSTICLDGLTKKAIYLKPYEVNSNNVEDLRIIIENIMDHQNGFTI